MSTIWDECLGISLSCGVEKSGIVSWGVELKEIDAYLRSYSLKGYLSGLEYVDFCVYLGIRIS